MFGSCLFVLYGVHALSVSFIYLFMYAKLFQYQMMFVSFISNTKGATNGAWTAYLLEHLSVHLFLMWFLFLNLQFSVQCFVDRCWSFILFYVDCLSFELRLLVTSLVSSYFFSPQDIILKITYNCHPVVSIDMQTANQKII